MSSITKLIAVSAFGASLFLSQAGIALADGPHKVHTVTYQCPDGTLNTFQYASGASNPYSTAHNLAREG